MKAYLLSLFVLSTLKLSALQIGGVDYTVDPKEWKEGSTYKNDAQEIITYVHEKESPTDWTELFTVQSVFNIDMKPSQFFDLFLRQLKVLVPSTNIQSKIIKDTDNELIAEWWIADSPKENQHEWIRMVKKDNNLVVLRFTTKKVDQIEKSKEKATKLLGVSL